MMCLSDLLITDDHDPLVATLSRGHRPQEQLRQVIGHWVPEGWTRRCLCYHHSVPAWDSYSSQVQIQGPHYSLHQGEKWPSWKFSQRLFGAAVSTTPTTQMTGYLNLHSTYTDADTSFSQSKVEILSSARNRNSCLNGATTLPKMNSKMKNRPKRHFYKRFWWLQRVIAFSRWMDEWMIQSQLFCTSLCRKTISFMHCRPACHHGHWE